MREIISAAINPIPMIKLEAAAKCKNFPPIIPILCLMKQNLIQPGRTAVINTYLTFPKKQMRLMGKLDLSFFNKPPKLSSRLKEFSALLSSPSKVSIAKFKPTTYNPIPVLIQNILKTRLFIQEAKLVEKPLTKFLLRQNHSNEISILSDWIGRIEWLSLLTAFAVIRIFSYYSNLMPYETKPHSAR